MVEARGDERPIIIHMAISQTTSGRFGHLSGALYRYLWARLRNIGLKSTHPQWKERATLCERCHLRVIKCGVSYCGNPLLEQIEREPAVDGCGCPCRDKAKSPGEHCPIDLRHQAARKTASGCSCKWCRTLSQMPPDQSRSIVTAE